MTDITDQDRRDARKWAENWRGDLDNDTSAAARVILATVDAPEPSLMDRMLDWWTHHHEDQVAFSTLAESVDQMEHDLADARAEVERLTAERITDPSLTLNDGSMTRPATVAREENVSPDLPEPADVKPGEVWEVIATDPAKSFGGTTSYNTVAFRMTDRWIVCRQGYQIPLVVPDDCIRLVRRHVPAPRVITDTDELEAMPSGAVIRDSAGVMFQRIVHGWYQAGDTSVHRSDDNFVCLPATVLWTPEVAA